MSFQESMDRVATWAKAESQKLKEKWPLGGKAERDLVAKWRRDRPKMAEALAKRGALLQMAHVLENLYVESYLLNLKEGMPPPDAREDAARAWLLQEPESEDDPENLPSSLRPLDPTTLSPIPRA